MRERKLRALFYFHQNNLHASLFSELIYVKSIIIIVNALASVENVQGSNKVSSSRISIPKEDELLQEVKHLKVELEYLEAIRIRDEMR